MQFLKGLGIFFLVIFIGAHLIFARYYPREKTATEIIQSKHESIEKSFRSWQKEAKLPLPQRYNFSSIDTESVKDNVFITGSRTGYGGYGFLLHSADNGKTWEILWQDKKTRAAKSLFLNRTIGYLATEDGVLKTEDGGLSWKEILTIRNIPGVNLYEIDTISMTNGRLIVEFKGIPNETVESSQDFTSWRYIIYHSKRHGSRVPTKSSYDQGKTWDNLNISFKEAAQLPLLFSIIDYIINVK